MRQPMLIAGLLSLLACSTPASPDAVSKTPAPSLVATGVRIQMETPSGALDATGRRLTLSEDGDYITLQGDVTLTTEQPPATISADTLTLALDRRALSLSGHVTSTFRMPAARKQP